MKKIAGFLSMVALLGNVALAADSSSKSGKKPEPTKEQRQQMAELHENMATCLKSDRLVSECRKEMMQACKETMGKDGCPMMGGKMGRGMRHRMNDGKE